jgi:uncharacterized protein
VTGLRVGDYVLLAPIGTRSTPGGNGTGTAALALNTCYGTVAEVDAGTAEHLARGDVLGLPQGVLEVLAERWIITAQSSEQQQRAFAAELDRRSRAALASRPRVYVMTGYDCNLKCVYCFQHGIRRTTPAVSLSREAARAALDHALRVLDGVPCPSVTLYGGEPLGPDNRGIVEFLCREARSRGIRLMASSHAWNLDRYEDLLGPRGIEAVHITVDGPARTHDRLRVGPRGAATFAAITDNIGLALARGAPVRMRVNVNEQVLEQLDELRAYLDERGFLTHPGFSAYVAPMFDTKAHVESGSSVLSQSLVGESALAARLGASTELAIAFDGYPPVYDPIAAMVAGRPPLPAVGHCCYGTRTVVLDPRGDVYPCVFLAGETRYATGSYLRTGPGREPERVEAWIAEGTRRCLDSGCRFALYCGAGSPYDAFAQCGETRVPSCVCADFPRTLAGYAAAAYRRRIAAAPAPPN